MNKAKKPFRPSGRVTTGTRECAECGAPAYSIHYSWCVVVKEGK